MRHVRCQDTIFKGDANRNIENSVFFREIGEPSFFSGRPGEEPALWWDDIVLKFSGDIETNSCPKAKREETYTCLCCDRKITKSQGSKSATAWKSCTGCISPVSKYIQRVRWRVEVQRSSTRKTINTREDEITSRARRKGRGEGAEGQELWRGDTQL